MLSPSVKRRITKLKQKKHRDKLGEFLVEGIKGAEMALLSDYEVQTVLVEDARKDESGVKKIDDLAYKKFAAVEYCSRKDIGSIKSTDTFPGVLAVVKKKEFEPADIQNSRPIIALDRVSDPGNLGTIIRTADWFGVDNILLSEDSVDAYNEKVVRSSMGSMFNVLNVQSDAIVEDVKQLKNAGYSVICLTTKGDDVADLKSDSKTVYIFGSESHGIRSDLEEQADRMYTIPGKGGAESLNVAISAGILMSRLS